MTATATVIRCMPKFGSPRTARAGKNIFTQNHAADARADLPAKKKSRMVRAGGLVI
jgi:hypothetical protein